MTHIKIAIFGATGTLGHAILNEAIARGHQVIAIVRDVSRVPKLANVTAVAGDILDPASIASDARGCDAVITAYGPGTGDSRLIVAAAQALVEGVRLSGAKRLVVVGGAGSLEVAPGKQLMDSPDFPPAWKDIAVAHRDAFDVYQAEGAGLSISYVSPAAEIAPGERTGRYRLGGAQLLKGANGRSEISVEDFAIVMVDEAETGKHAGQRITAAY